MTPPGITVRNSLPALAQKQDPARSTGTRKTSSARAGEGEGRGRPRRASSSGRPARPAHPTAAEPGRRGPRCRRGAGRASVALGRQLLLAAAPRAGRRGYCLDSACRALRPRRRRRRRGRLGPEPRGRASLKAAPSPGSPSGRPFFRPSLPAFPSCPRTLFSLSRFPAAVPSLPSSFFFQGGGGSPGKRRGWGQAAAGSPHELAGPRQGPRLRPAPPRHIHSSERLRGEGRVGEGREGEERKEEEGSWGGGELLPHRPRRQQRHRPGGEGEETARRCSAVGAGAGRPPAGFTPTANSRAGGRREPVTARGGGAGRRRRRRGAVDPGPGGGGAGGGGGGSRARRGVRPAQAQARGGLPAAPQPPEVGDADDADPDSSAPRRGG